MKAQVAVEFVVFSSIFLLFMIGVVVLVNLYGGQEERSTNYLLASEMANRISQSVAITASMGEGFSYRIRLPKILGKSEYNITLVNATDSESSRVFVELPYENSVSTTVFSNINCENAKIDASGRTICELEPGKEYVLKVVEQHTYISEG